MLRKAAAGLAGLGLIGGAGSVVYNDHGDAVVRIKDGNGVVRTVQISAVHGTSFSCPDATREKLRSMDIATGRIKLTLQDVRSEEHALEAKYPDHRAPHAVVVRYNALVARDHRLVKAYNAEVDAHNATLDQACSAN